MLLSLRSLAASSLALSVALAVAPARADMPADDGDGSSSAPCDDKEEGDACSVPQGAEDFEGVCIGKSEGLECCDADGNCEGGVSESGCAIAPGEPGSLVGLGVFAAAAALAATRRRDARR